MSGSAPGATAVPWTAWYNVHERHSLSEFKAEGVILIIACFIVAFHIIGARANRNKAKRWMKANSPALLKEFAVVGFGGVPTIDADVKTDALIKEKSLFEFATYATGRQNTAFMDVKLTLSKKFNPIVNGVETAMAFFSDSFAMPVDIVEAVTYPFDGKENQTVPSLPGAAETRSKDSKSSFDGFVWAIVSKDVMAKARDERYDLSLTTTRDSPKLPNWLTVMTESAEISDLLLTQELIDAVVAAGNNFEYLIISDQPQDKPKTLEETAPRKRIFLKHRLPSNPEDTALLNLFSQYLRLPDFLAQNAHFRPEALRKVRATREAMVTQIKKSLDEAQSEERALEREKAKKAKRDAELQGLDAKAQKKYLDREREKELRKSQKKSTMRG